MVDIQWISLNTGCLIGMCDSLEKESFRKMNMEILNIGQVSCGTWCTLSLSNVEMREVLWQYEGR